VGPVGTVGAGIPALGFGTWDRKGEEGIAAILHALEVGYRHLDTAQSYGTEDACGEAIARSSLPRDDVFVTTKVRQENFDPGRLRPSVEQSLEALQLDRIDLLLLHWPARDDRLPMEVYLGQLAEVQDAGLARLIGVSNFTIGLLDRASAILGDRPIAANQVEIHIYGQNSKLAAYCRAAGIPTVAYCPIAKGLGADDPVLADIAAAHDATWAQVALAFLIAEGHAAIPTSGDHERIASNFAAAALDLAADEIARLRTLDRGQHLIDDRSWMPVWDS